nr:uncharacterized protein LOC105348541 [Crassostrea gigas]
MHLGFYVFCLCCVVYFSDCSDNQNTNEDCKPPFHKFANNCCYISRDIVGADEAFVCTSLLGEEISTGEKQEGIGGGSRTEPCLKFHQHRSALLCLGKKYQQEKIRRGLEVDQERNHDQNDVFCFWRGRTRWN